MNAPKAKDVKSGISALWETLQCPICLDLMVTPVSTKCDHQFCKFCVLKLLDSSKQNQASCPVCKAKIAKRSLQESPGFQRLVAGLQDMITAYEHDTGTNYFTGISQHKEQLKVTVEAVEQQDILSGDCSIAESEEHPVNDLPKSHSSTIAARTGFADLMGFEDSSPLTTENEGLDSGLGEPPLRSDKRIHNIIHLADREKVEVIDKTTAPHKMDVSVLGEGSTQPPLNPDDTNLQTVRKLSRKMNKKALKTETILDEKQKRSLEKVAEWLMKVPAEGSLELDHQNKVDGDSDSCSSSSTIDVRQHNADTNPSRQQQGKALEDKVFGAVYRRGRRSNRTVCPPFDHLNEPTETKEKESECVSSEKSVSATEERLQAAGEKKLNSSDALGDELMVDDYRGQIAENESNNGKKEVSDCRQQPARTSRKRTRNTVQQVDAELLEQAQAMSQIPKRRGQNLRSEKSNRVSMIKPLELVVVPNEEANPVAHRRSEDVQVHIENYPSSEDQAVPSKRNTRRSRRRQVFTDAMRRKAKSNVDSSQKGTLVSKQPDETEGTLLDEKTSPNATTAAKDPERNGCICNDDLGGIENMEISRRSQENVKGKISEGENPKSFLDEGAAAVPSSGSPAEVSISPSHRPPSSTQVDAPVGETPVAGCEEEEEEVKEEEEEEEEEEDRNDSELDTEQLLRSFKGTKRKSFHLGGGPTVKRSRGSDQAEVQRSEDDASDVLGGSKETRARTPEAVEGNALGSCENLSCNDVISPSISPRRAGVTLAAGSLPAGSPSQDAAGDGALSVSSRLPPNTRSKRRDADSSGPSVVPRVGDSGLYFVSAEPSDLLSARSQTAGSQAACVKPDQAEQITNEESCLTPDGLGKTLRSSCSGELSGLSPVKSAARKRVQRLRSSSGSSDCTGDGLPSLAEMFGKRSSGGDGQMGADDVDNPQSPEVQSSQASVDLFGTPEEGEAAANDPCASAESSQLSSDVLVTQQKLEMQKELVRLEKLMALVSEVLQEKESSPVREVPPRTDHSCRVTESPHGPLPEDQAATPERKPVPEAQHESFTRSADVKGLQRVTRSKPGGAAELTPPPVNSPGPGVKDAAAPRTRADTPRNDGSPSENKENNTPAREQSGAKVVLVTSGLDPRQQAMVKRFAKQLGARVASKVMVETTHVVMNTDDQLVCERTLKYFLGIAGRKWVVSFQWISECFKQKKLLAESPFEVRGDVVNGSDHQGPRRARGTEDSNLLMKDLRICFQGTFTDMTTDEMQWMVELCGAAVVADPLLLDAKQKSRQLVIFQPGTESLSSHSALSRRATVVTRGWLLDSVATYSLQDCSKYRPEQRTH